MFDKDAYLKRNVPFLSEINNSQLLHEFLYEFKELVMPKGSYVMQ
jgi:hypothetical protein